MLTHFHNERIQDYWKKLRGENNYGKEGFNRDLFSPGEEFEHSSIVLDDCIIYDLACKMTRVNNGESYEVVEHKENWGEILRALDVAMAEGVKIRVPDDYDSRIRNNLENGNAHSGVIPSETAVNETIKLIDSMSAEVNLDIYIPGLEIKDSDLGYRDKRIAMASLHESELLTYDEDFLEIGDIVDVNTPLGFLYRLD